MSADLILKTIQGWRWFSHLPPEAHQWLVARASVRQIPKGKTIYAPGDRVQAIYGVIDGAFRIFLRTPKGEELTMEEVVAGGWFSHGMLREPPVYITDCICHQDATVVVIPQAAVAEFAQRWPLFYKGLYEEFTDRAIIVFGKIELLSLHNLNVRLAVYLLRIARLRGKPDGKGGIMLAGDDSQAEVGSRVGGTRQRVNSLLSAWAKRGLLESGKDGIRLLDIPALEAEATKTGFDLAGYLGGWHGGWQGGKEPRG